MVFLGGCVPHNQPPLFHPLPSHITMDNLPVPTNHRLSEKIANYMCARFHFLAWRPENPKPMTPIDLPVHSMREQGKPNNTLSKCLSHCISTDACLPATILSAAMSIMNPKLFKDGMEGMTKLNQYADESDSKMTMALQHWSSVFTNMQLIATVQHPYIGTLTPFPLGSTYSALLVTMKTASCTFQHSGLYWNTRLEQWSHSQATYSSMQ